MISALSLADRNGVDVPLLRSDDKVLPTDLEGFWGVEAPRQVKRPRPTGHGSLNDSRYGDGRLMSAAFECIGTDYADTESVFHAVTAPMVDTWDTGPAAIKWTGVDVRQGLTNLCTNPKAGAGITTDWANAALDTLEPVVLGGANPTAPTSELPTALHFVDNTGGGSGNYAFAATSGITYTVVVWVYVVTGAQVRVRFHDGGGITKATTGILGSGAWQQVSLSVAADSTATWTLRMVTSVAPAEFYATGVMLAVGTSVTDYFDGDSEWCYWNGTPHASTSTFDHSLQRLVKLDSDVTPHISGGNDRELVFQAQFFAEDPRAYTVHQDLISSTALSTASGGLKFPMKFPFKFTPSGGGTATVTNKGNRPTPPVFRIYGMCVNPAIVNVDSGERITIAGTIANGDFLEIDVANRTAKLNGGTLQNNLIDSVNTTWFELPRGSTNLQLTSGTFDGTARLDTLLRSAYA